MWARNGSSSFEVQRRIAGRTRTLLADHLQPKQIEWLNQFESWCNDRIDRITTKPWVEYEWNHLGVLESKGTEQQKPGSDTTTYLLQLERSKVPLDRPKPVPHFVLR